MLVLSGLYLVIFWVLASSFSLSFLIDKVPRQITSLDKHSQTLTCHHVTVTSFFSHHCLPYHLSVRFVHLSVLDYGFLYFLLSPVVLKKVFDHAPLKEQTLFFHKPLQIPNWMLITDTGQLWTLQIECILNAAVIHCDVREDVLTNTGCSKELSLMDCIKNSNHVCGY